MVPTEGDPILYSKVKAADVDLIVEKHFNLPAPAPTHQQGAEGGGDHPGRRTVVGRGAVFLSVQEKHVSSFLGKQIPMATEFRGIINPTDIEEYKSRDGFRDSPPGAEGNDTGGNHQGNPGQRHPADGAGAGFPTGRNGSWWLPAKGKKKCIICNGDEGDPGAFMDRMLLESYPFRIIEGMVAAACAVGATDGILYIRARYSPSGAPDQRGPGDLPATGVPWKEHPGQRIRSRSEGVPGSGGLCVRRGDRPDGIHRRGSGVFRRMRPPFPAVKGLWGHPTLINNTETFAQISYILKNTASAFNRIGTDSSKGTKVFALAGKVARGGLIEVPMGITIREVVEEIGGGVAGGKKFKAVQIGGPSGGCVPSWMADTAIDFESLKEVGAMMGSGGLVVLDESDCMVDIARYFLTFTQQEACGKCSFGRIGTKRMLEILEKMTRGQGSEEDLKKLEELAGWTQKGSLCGLCKTAPNPILSTLQYFRDEYEAHLRGECPAGKCKDLIQYQITDDCIGCTLCAQDCPVDAIAFTPHQVHVIDQELCIKCDGCKQVCPENAVITK
ncbi:MAG: NADH-ubiquinone oxidoreductase-F iron-sulfur binding region domain-containing protein [Bacteroidales bacterium]